jgi:hypothetical protein
MPRRKRTTSSEPASSRPADGELTEDALDEQIVDLPPREALSIVDPSGFGIGLPIPPANAPEGVAATPTDAEPIEPTP